VSRLLSMIGSTLAGLFRPARPAAPPVPEAHREWLHEQLREYSTDRLYASPRDSDLNPTGETWEMRLAYRKAMKEPAIKGPLLKKVYAVASLDVQVMAEDADSPADQDAATWLDWAVQHARGGWPRLLHDCCVHPLIDGFGVGEKVTERVQRGKYKGRWGLHAVKFKETEQLRFHLDKYRNIVSVRSFAGAMAGREFDPSDFLLLTHMPLWENPFGQSDLRAAYRAFYLIEAAIKLRGMMLENFSGPFLVLKNSQPAFIDQARAALSAARARGYIVLQPQDDLNVVNLATSAPDQFQSTIDDLRKEAATAIAGAYLQMLESDTPQGNSETHKGVSELFEWWLAASVGSAITEQLVHDLHDPHYPDTVGRPRVILGGVDPQAATKAGEKLTTAKALGLPLSKAQAYELLELEPPADPDDTLGGEQPGGGLPGMGGGGDPAVPPGPGGDGAPMDTPDAEQGGDSSAPVPGELLAAMIQAAEAEDWDAVERLKALAGDPEQLAQATGAGQPKQFADGERKTGEVWQGKGNRWYTKRQDGRVVPAANPNAEKKQPRDPAAPKRDVVAEAKAAKAGREPGREQARTSWQAALQDPRRVTAAQLPALADGLRSLTRDELREMGRGLRQKLGGLKEDLVQRLLSHVGAKGAGGASSSPPQYGAWGAAAGGGEKPSGRDEFPKRGVSAGVSAGEKAEPSPEKDAATFAAAFDEFATDGNNFVNLADIKDRFPHLSRDQFHALLNDMRRSGEFTAKSRERVAPMTDREAEVVMSEEGEDILYVSRRRDHPNHPDNRPTQPKLEADTPFTGTDAQGREWRDGELVAKVEEGTEATTGEAPAPKTTKPKAAKPKATPKPTPAAEQPAGLPAVKPGAAQKPDAPEYVAAGRALLADDGFRQDLADAYNHQILFVEHRDGLVALPRLYDQVRRARPDLTLDQFHAAIDQLSRERQSELHVLNEVSTEPTAKDNGSILRGDRLYHYVRLKHKPDGAKGADPDRMKPAATDAQSPTTGVDKPTTVGNTTPVQPQSAGANTGGGGMQATTAGTVSVAKVQPTPFVSRSEVTRSVNGKFVNVPVVATAGSSEVKFGDDTIKLRQPLTTSATLDEDDNGVYVSLGLVASKPDKQELFRRGVQDLPKQKVYVVAADGTAAADLAKTVGNLKSITDPVGRKSAEEIIRTLRDELGVVEGR
jgi:hypothetical protein